MGTFLEQTPTRFLAPGGGGSPPTQWGVEKKATKKRATPEEHKYWWNDTQIVPANWADKVAIRLLKHTHSLSKGRFHQGISFCFFSQHSGRFSDIYQKRGMLKKAPQGMHRKKCNKNAKGMLKKCTLHCSTRGDFEFFSQMLGKRFGLQNYLLWTSASWNFLWNKSINLINKPSWLGCRGGMRKLHKLCVY